MKESIMSFWRNYYHIVWGTKNRLPLIRPGLEDRIFSIIIKQAAKMNSFVHVIGGTEDHVHVLIAIPPKHAVSDVVKQMKGSSTHLMNKVISPYDHFEWQRGYGCLSLGKKQLPVAEAYIQNQKIHHAEGTTNTWLERSSGLDESPDDNKREGKDEKKGLVREEAGNYETPDDFPF
jgi:putative transposase